MRVFLSIAILVIFSSCCEKCPEKTASEHGNQASPIKVDVPDVPDRKMDQGNSLTLVITEEDKYLINNQEIEFDAIQLHIEDLRRTDPKFNDIIKIKGDKDASFHAVFKVMALADQLSLKPALAYRK